MSKQVTGWIVVVNAAQLIDSPKGVDSFRRGVLKQLIGFCLNLGSELAAGQLHTRSWMWARMPTVCDRAVCPLGRLFG